MNETSPHDPSFIPPTPPGPPTDTSGTGIPTSQPDLLQRIDDASRGAVAEHESIPKRKGGWPKGRRREVPMGKMDRGTVSVLPPPDGGFSSSQSFEGNASPFDEQAASALIDGAIEALNDLAAAWQRNAAMGFTGDAQIAESAALSARMSDKVKGTVRVGALQCLKKYAVDLQYAPELTLAVGLGLWSLGNYFAFKKMKEQGARQAKPTTGPL